MSVWDAVEELPPDAIFLTKTLYQQDEDPRKINLGIGAYRDEEGKPYVLEVVRKVERELLEDRKENKEYAPIGGDKEFIRLAQQLVLGAASPALAEGRAAGVQSLSGTGALRLLCDFVKRNFPDATVYKSKPTWGNHRKILLAAGLQQSDYRYFHPATKGLDLDGMLEDLGNAPPGSLVLLHACAHNPTGVDPTAEQWAKIADVLRSRKLIPFFDSAYQGYATGDLDGDAAAIRLFEAEGFEMLVAQSFSKNLGLYGERCGCASVVCQTAAQAQAVNSQLCAVIRPMYSNPPRHGASIVKRVLGDQANFAAWVAELQMMSGRILEMRKALFAALQQLGTPGTWNHVVDQIGMFSFTGLSEAQVQRMLDTHHIYMLKNGRISMAGVARRNVQYIAAAMDDVVRNTKGCAKL